MSRTIVPRDKVRLPTGLRCPSDTCKNRVRRHEAVSGIESHFLLGRIVTARCLTCGNIGLVEA